MWKIGGSLPPFSNDGVNSIPDFSYLGLDSYEYACQAQNLNLAESKKSKVIELTKEHKVSFSLHGEFFSVKMCNEAEFNYFEHSRFITNSLYYAKYWNCPVVLHPGGKDNHNSTQLDFVVNNLGRAISEVGIDPSLVYLETMGKVSQFGNIQQLINISQILNTRICVDFAHLYAVYMVKYGMFTDYMVRDILNVMKELPFSNECYFHISGMEWNNKGEVRHQELDKSDFPWKMVLDEIKSSNLTGTIIVESGRDGANDAREVKKYMIK